MLFYLNLILINDRIDHITYDCQRDEVRMRFDLRKLLVTLR